MSAKPGTVVYVLDVYDVGEHTGQYVFPNAAEIRKAVALIRKHEGLEEDPRDGYVVSKYAIENFKTWRRAYLYQMEDAGVR